MLLTNCSKRVLKVACLWGVCHLCEFCYYPPTQALTLLPSLSHLLTYFRMLVGVGAQQWAKQHGFPICDPDELITGKQTWTDYTILQNVATRKVTASFLGSSFVCNAIEMHWRDYGYCVYITISHIMWIPWYCNIFFTTYHQLLFPVLLITKRAWEQQAWVHVGVYIL